MTRLLVFLYFAFLAKDLSKLSTLSFFLFMALVTTLLGWWTMVCLLLVMALVTTLEQWLMTDTSRRLVVVVGDLMKLESCPDIVSAPQSRRSLTKALLPSLMA